MRKPWKAMAVVLLALLMLYGVFLVNPIAYIPHLIKGHARAKPLPDAIIAAMPDDSLPGQPYITPKL